MDITGTHFNYYLICRRKLWLFANSIQMEHTSELVYEGKLIHENSYRERSEKYKEVAIGGIKIDYYDPLRRVVHEIKKSDKKEEAHIWQLKYYLYVLEQSGVEVLSGVLEYPKLRKTMQVLLTIPDREAIKDMLSSIGDIINFDKCPSKLPVSKCRNCSYFDFCYSTEDD